MNLRLYSIAILISALPYVASAGTGISLTQEDFVAAERMTAEGDTVVKVKLSKSGKAKFKKLNRKGTGQTVHTEIGGVNSDLTLRKPVEGDHLQIGPYTAADADRVIKEINE
jgi:hypothetical protein